MLGRGYGGHEYLDMFGLVNMNARLYDPALGRFLSPDPYVQAPDNSQNFNRYSYGMNNPLKYTDPSGEFIFGYTSGFFRGLFSGKNPFKEGWKGGVNEVKIWGGLFTSDSRKNFGGQVWEIASRFTWQLPQTLVGLSFAGISNYAGQVDEVGYWGGATVTSGNNWGESAVTLGSYIVGDPTIKANPHNSLFQHEYGHYLQGQEMGWGYLSRIGFPSLMSADGTGMHKFQPFEQDANRRAFLYLNENVDGFYQTKIEYDMNRIKGNSIGWDFWQNPLDVNHISWGSRGQYRDYNDVTHQALLNNLSLRTKWYDYLGGILFGMPTGIGNGIYYRNNRIQ